MHQDGSLQPATPEWCAAVPRNLRHSTRITHRKLVAAHHFVHAGANLRRRVWYLADSLLIEQLSPFRNGERLLVFLISGQIAIVLFRPQALRQGDRIAK